MAGSSKKLEAHEEAEQELYLRDGRKLVVGEEAGEQLVEIRSESGLLELRVKLTEQGPVLQMESLRMTLKAAESVEIESKRVSINGTEQLELTGNDVHLGAEHDLKVDAKNDVRVVGKMIYLN